jgi:hypothetical protein
MEWMKGFLNFFLGSKVGNNMLDLVLSITLIKRENCLYVKCKVHFKSKWTLETILF